MEPRACFSFITLDAHHDCAHLLSRAESFVHYFISSQKCCVANCAKHVIPITPPHNDLMVCVAVLFAFCDLAAIAQASEESCASFSVMPFDVMISRIVLF